MSSSPSLPRGTWLLVLAVCLVLLPGRAAAFGAGNIPSIAQVEGHNWRHGDIEDMLASVAFLHGKKWTSMLIKRTYFGNWLRDYSQAVDVGSLKGVNAATIRILVWVLSFMAFGYATEEFEVTEERLGCYRPEEHIDNPLGYADGVDARTFDPRLRGPVQPVETEIDMKTGMKNYIANETGQWATSTGYIRFSFARSIHFGRLYTCGERGKGKDENLCEALRCLGQALHCLEDFGAHSNYCELALRELGYHNVFPHCGTQTEINIQGKRIYPIVTGTFGAVDFLHSVIGEANDHFTQSEVDEVDVALKNAEGARSGPVATGDRGLFDGSGPTDFISLLSKLPDVGTGFASEARDLKEASEAQERENRQNQQRTRADNANVVPGMSPDFDPVKTAKRIYPILMFRDKIVKAISRGIAKVPGLEKLLEHISETLTAFVLGLLAPFIRPIINSVTKVLKEGSSGIISASSKSQLEPWENNRCSDPTHSMLSKDHFTNILNSCAGRVAATILQYAVPRVIFAWENPNVPVDEVVNDVIRAFHHPALRSENIEIQRDMFQTVRMWADQHPRRHELERILSSESVKTGKNHILNGAKSGSSGGGHSHSAFDALSQLGHGKVAGSLWSQVRTRDLDSMSGNDGEQAANYVSNSPAPETSKMPTPPSYTSTSGGGEAASYMNEPNTFQAGYNAPPPPGQYYQGYGQQPPPGGPQGYPGTQQYGAPPPGQWQQPPQGYGGPPPQGYPPYGQGQPPSWNQYPGQGRY
ncbi:hypothetical protein H634G_03531 [Metarhizium anisopliae BRIP 53293]|uniref:Uncharacterized protein n=1 Tax=Metarhizium anisopliae BRIP 53293 TaxID=1291518 RepID=A0A0D9P4D1_METAN|nr:hypothetical protein H634G_03531 [Metarhizium anisopliae BRIP 53293]KJK96006.1 hypothetical protein H633G_00130 [Metarhizium anisopliae BRIP 53284]